MTFATTFLECARPRGLCHYCPRDELKILWNFSCGVKPDPVSPKLGARRGCIFCSSPENQSNFKIEAQQCCRISAEVCQTLIFFFASTTECCLYPQHEHISRVSFLCVSLCVCLHACTQQFTDHQHRLTCSHRRRLDQTAFGFAFVKTCVAHVPDIVIEYTRIPQW